MYIIILSYSYSKVFIDKEEDHYDRCLTTKLLVDQSPDMELWFEVQVRLYFSYLEIQL